MKCFFFTGMFPTFNNVISTMQSDFATFKIIPVLNEHCRGKILVATFLTVS